MAAFQVRTGARLQKMDVSGVGREYQKHALRTRSTEIDQKLRSDDR